MGARKRSSQTLQGGGDRTGPEKEERFFRWMGLPQVLKVAFVHTVCYLVGRKLVDEVTLVGQVCGCITKVTGFYLVNAKILQE